ncbi:Transglutaminase-like cysteine protease [Natranaeroarchaeum sulfidigenes]|uniref:Transglutaminase-like cysteine protease n=1 Tax=Natranaeroarchaeum sulfidigenes TaxID=2784880 RepID=A0A897MZQ4_9EURY|nr:Transglutaminase-like cysteine protease [Natranaeroarchaeum sulfidigenes]
MNPPNEGPPQGSYITRRRTLGGDSDGYDPRRDLTLIAIAVLVFGTLTVGVLGFGATPVLDDGDDDGTVFPVQDWRDDGPEEVQLVVEANRSEITPGDTAEFTVTYENETAATDATVQADGTEYDLDGAGQTTITFDRGGEFTVRAEREGTDQTQYISDAMIISVERFEIDLLLDADEEEITAGDEVTFSLQRSDTGEAVSGSVTVDGEDHETNEVGRVTIPFDQSGTFEATGSAPDTDTETFRDGPTTISVEPRTVGLSLSQNIEEPRVGDDVTIEIRRTDTDEPVNATVDVDGEQRIADEGVLSLTADRATQLDISATAPDTDSETFETVTETVRFARHEAPLALQPNQTTVERGEAVEFTGIRTDTDEPVPGTLSVDDRTAWLDWQGTTSLTFDEAGTVPVTLARANTTTHTFPSDEVTITVLDTQYEIDGIDAPERVDRGDEAVVEATIHNTGSDDGTPTVGYVFDGDEQTTQSLEIGSDERETVTFEVPTNLDPGEHEHAVTTRDEDASMTIVIEDGDT